MAINYRHHKRKLQSRKPFSTNRCHPHVNTHCTIAKTLLNICTIKLKLQSIATECSNLKAEYFNLINRSTVAEAVKVEKLGRGFVARLRCKKREGRLVSVLEAFDKMGLNVLQAKVCSKYLFSMETIVAPQEGHCLDKSDVAQALQKAIEENMEKEAP